MSLHLVLSNEGLLCNCCFLCPESFFLLSLCRCRGCGLCFRPHCRPGFCGLGCPPWTPLYRTQRSQGTLRLEVGANVADTRRPSQYGTPLPTACQRSECRWLPKVAERMHARGTRKLRSGASWPCGLAVFLFFRADTFFFGNGLLPQRRFPLRSAFLPLDCAHQALHAFRASHAAMRGGMPLALPLALALALALA